MDTLNEYRECIKEIEEYRAKREQLYGEINRMQCEIKARKEQGVDVEQLQKRLEETLELDEEYGARMHELTIKRNLLED